MVAVTLLLPWGWLSPAYAQLPAGTWQYAWGDDFSGRTLDLTKWSYNYPWGTTHNHDATMTADNARLGDGTLSLVAERTGTAANFKSGAISSGYTNETINGGYIEARILLTNTPGSWPAFWGLYNGWPPECDIMEYPIDTAAGAGYAQDQYHTAFHYSTGSGNAAGAGQVNPGSAGDLGGSYHTFGLRWIEDDYVGFYFDGALVSSFDVDAGVAQMQAMYLIFNQAVGGWPGTPNTTEWPVGHTDTMKVDWVRVWTSAAAKTSNWVNATAAENASWDTAGNWSNGVPNLGGVTSSFSSVNAATQLIDWSGRRALSVINLDGATRYRFGWPDDRLVLGAGNGGAIAPAINIAATSTVAHEIWGELEWTGTLGINNNSAYPLQLTGKVMGGDGITIDGSGVVSFDGTSSYSGTTVIDSGAQGPGVARARGQHALGRGGLVVIGQSGNATTARLELENSSLVSNVVHFNGRTSSTPGIVNNSGTSTISGTVIAQSGGSEYWIQSDAGQLRLTGSPAMSSQASGSRVFTLRGAGDGEVGGSVENGSATVGLVKTGTGKWTFAAANTYTGTTTVSAGTLQVNGSTGAGATTVGSGATLGGRGTVRNNLTAQAGATVRVGEIGFPSLANQPFQGIEDFQGYPAGGIGPTTTTQNTTGQVWLGAFDGTANAEIANNSGNLAMSARGTNAASGWRGAITDLKAAHGSDFSLPHGATGTYFFRVRRMGTATIDAVFGLTDQAAKTYTAPGNDTVSPWDEYAVMLSIAGSSGSSMLRAFDDGDGDVNITSAAPDQWLNVWITVNNAAKSFRVATSTGSNSGIDSGRAYDFGRRTAATVGSNALVTFGMHEARNVAAQLDDLSFTAGTNLTNPLATVAVPTAETLTIENGLTIEAGATLEFDLASASMRDRLVVGGLFNAAGNMRVILAAGAPAPALGNSYDFFDAAGGTVQFLNYDLPPLAAGLKWDTAAIGSGILSVAADPTVYAGWVLGKPFAPGTDGPAFDVEPDGIANAFEWLLGSDPFVSDPTFLPLGTTRTATGSEFPAAVSGKTYLSLTATIRKNISGMTLVPQAASSLELLGSPGSSSQVDSALLQDLGGFEKREWFYTVPVEDAAAGFMRLKLEGN